MENFTSEAYAAFQEAAAEKYDFATCQRPDGSYYGTGGTCRKGSPVSGGVPKKERKGKTSGGGAAPTSKDVKALDKAAKAADKKADAADKKFQKSKSPADRKEAKRLDKIAKDANKKADSADKKFQAAQKRADTKKRQQAFEKELDKRKAKMKGASPDEQSRLISEASKAASNSVKSGGGSGGGMTLRDAQKSGMTTGGSKNPNWRKANNEAASRQTVKKTSNKDRAKD